MFTRSSSRRWTTLHCRPNPRTISSYLSLYGERVTTTDWAQEMNKETFDAAKDLDRGRSYEFSSVQRTLCDKADCCIQPGGKFLFPGQWSWPDQNAKDIFSEISVLFPFALAPSNQLPYDFPCLNPPMCVLLRILVFSTWLFPNPPWIIYQLWIELGVGLLNF